MEDIYDRSGFVSVSDVIPDVILEIRYYSTYNFVGARVDGYEAPVALLTREAAEALRLVSELEALSHLPRAGRLSGVVKQRLVNGGCTMLDERTVDFPDEIDIVTDYHVGRILSLRRKLREALEEMNRWERRKRS